MMRKDRRRHIILVTLLGVATMALPTANAAPPEPTVWVEPAQVDVRPDESFEVQVMIDDVEDLAGFEITIAYDPSVIELTEAARGDFLGSTGRMTVPVGPQIDEEQGTVALGALSLGQGAGPNGSGILATINGKALKDGNTALRVEKLELFNTAPELLSVTAQDGEVRVGGSNPEPSQPLDAPARTTPWAWIVGGGLLALVGAAAGAFALRRRKPQAGPENSLG